MLSADAFSSSIRFFCSWPNGQYCHSYQRTFHALIRSTLTNLTERLEASALLGMELLIGSNRIDDGADIVPILEHDNGPGFPLICKSLSTLHQLKLIPESFLSMQGCIRRPS